MSSENYPNDFSVNSNGIVKYMPYNSVIQGKGTLILE